MDRRNNNESFFLVKELAIKYCEFVQMNQRNTSTQEFVFSSVLVGFGFDTFLLFACIEAYKYKVKLLCRYVSIYSYQASYLVMCHTLF